MSLIHRYILRELLSPAILGLLVFTFLLLIQAVFDALEDLVGAGVGLGTVGRIFLNLIPQVLSVTLPMAMLVAALLSFGRLATDREIMAMRTSGLTVWWLITPPLILGLILSIGLCVLNFEVIPRLKLQRLDLEYQILFQATAGLEPSRVYEDFSLGGEQEMSFMFDERGANPGDLRGVLIHAVTEGKVGSAGRALTVTSNTGRIEPDLDRRAIRIGLEDGTVQIVSRLPQAPGLRVLQFESLEQWIRPTEMGDIEGGVFIKEPGQMVTSELFEAIGEETDEERRIDLLVERARRLAFPFSTLAFLLIGIPFGIVTRASGKGLGLAISFMLILLYYGLLEWGSAVAETGSALGSLAVFSPNVVLGSIGVYMILKVSRQ